MYNLTNKQKELLIWLVSHIKSGNLGESFSVMITQETVRAIAPSKDISKYVPKGVDKGTFMALASNDLLICKETRAGLDCTILGNAYEAVKSNFGKSNAISTTTNSTLLIDPKLISDYFNMDEFKALCFEVGVNPDEFGNKGISAASFELVTYMQRRGLVDKLVTEIIKQRPHLQQLLK